MSMTRRSAVIGSSLVVAVAILMGISQVGLFGGRDFLDLNYRDFNDTWVGDGVTWTCVSACP
jgi:hypothetical protein